MRCSYKIPNNVKNVQPGLRLVLTTNCDEEVIENKIKKWAGEYLNSEFFDGKKIFNIISNNGLKGIVQQILIIIQVHCRHAK